MLVSSDLKTILNDRIINKLLVISTETGQALLYHMVSVVILCNDSFRVHLLIDLP